MKTNFLKKLPKEKPLKINALSGKRTIGNAENVFKFWINPSFKDYPLNLPDNQTDETEVELFELIKDLKTIELAEKFGDDFKKTLFTQDQIIDFSENHPEEFTNEKTIMFFAEKNEVYYIVLVIRFRDNLNITYHLLDSDLTFLAINHYRLLLPK